MTAGMIFGTVGLIVLTQIGPGSSYGLLLAGYLLFGIAIGLVYAPMSTAAMAAMPAEKVGIASGVLAMDRIVAGSTWVAVVLCLFGAGLAWAFVRDPSGPAPEPHAARHRHFHL